MFCLLSLSLSPGKENCFGQVTLADDIILAGQGKENASKSQKTNLGRTPGTLASPFHRSPGSTDVILGPDPNRRIAPLAQRARRPVNPAHHALPNSGGLPIGQGLAPAIEKIRMPGALPEQEPSGSDAGAFDDLGDQQAGPTALSLDAAIDLLVHSNKDLQSKYLEIPQAQADVLTAGLRENPLFFYSTDQVPYSAYSKQRPGQVGSGISVVFPIDYSGKRRARVTVAEREKCVLEAQYRDAVRLAIDNLYTAFVDVLAQQQSSLTADRGLKLLDQLLAQARSKLPRGDEDEDAIDDLTIERELAAMSREDQRGRQEEARRKLGELLGLTAGEADTLKLQGTLRDPGPEPPALGDLVSIALGQRPDLVAHRLGIERAQAELMQERAERFSDAYFLYTPFEYRDNHPEGTSSTSAWGAGLFISVPLFNRNQGNLRKARYNIDQSQVEARAVEQSVISEVRQAVGDLKGSRADLQRLEKTAVPALKRKRDRALRKLRAGEMSMSAFLAIERDSTSLVRYYRQTLARHRRNALKLNTAVGHRVMP